MHPFTWLKLDDERRRERGKLSLEEPRRTVRKGEGSRVSGAHSEASYKKPQVNKWRGTVVSLPCRLSSAEYRVRLRHHALSDSHRRTQSGYITQKCCSRSPSAVFVMSSCECNLHVREIYRVQQSKVKPSVRDWTLALNDIILTQRYELHQPLSLEKKNLFFFLFPLWKATSLYLYLLIRLFFSRSKLTKDWAEWKYPEGFKSE